MQISPNFNIYFITVFEILSFKGLKSHFIEVTSPFFPHFRAHFLENGNCARDHFF